MQTARGLAVGLEQIHKTYANGYHALRGVDLRVESGEWLVLVGASGCGKTTTLRIIAGLEEPDDGTVRFDGNVANHVPAWRRGVSMVFQRPALPPTQVVRRILMSAQPDDPGKIAVISDRLGLTAELDRYPHQLSGGQQQRVALGRALLRRAPLCLLDEPLGHLDAPLRDDLRRQLRIWHHLSPATVISVTHDPREAWALGNRIAVMDRGQVLQAGTPDEVYRKPANRFVASFIAQGPMNFFDAQLRREQNSIQWAIREWPESIPAAADYAGNPDPVLGLRAEHVSIGADARFPMTAELVEPTPRGCWVTGAIGGHAVTGWAEPSVAVTTGQTVGVTMDWTKAYLFDRVTGKTLYAPIA